VAQKGKKPVKTGARDDNVAPYLLVKENSCVNVLLPRSIDSTIVQNIVIIAIASNITS
jgi:hypothetical protein